MYNRIIILILALLFLSCREDNENPDLCLMTFSDAQPVQFWLIDCNTFNQQVSDGVHHKCFCQPWQCDDPIKIQFTDDGSATETEAITLPPLSEWLSASTDPDQVPWNLGASPDVTLPGTGALSAERSEYLYVDYGFISGRDYSITIDYDRTVNSGASNPRTSTLAILDDFNSVQFSNDESAGAGSNSITVEFTANEDTTRIGFQHNSGSNVTITVNDVSGTASVGDSFVLSVRDESGNELLQLPFDSFDNGNTFVYNLTLIPEESSPDLCDQFIQFVIIDETTGTERAQSDCQDIRVDQPNTILSNYRNHRNIFGLVYEDQSPDLDFYLRIPAIFYHQRFPKVEETMELSSSLVSLNSTIRRQRRMDTDYLPYYFHEKIQLMLMHQFVTIYDREWVSQDEYDIAEGNKMYPLKTARIWISEKEFVQRNVL
jgi:hypothetical protein